MMKKIVGIFVCMLLITTIFPCVGASINETVEKENIIVFESRIFGVGFVRIHSLTHTIKGYVLFGINEGKVIIMQFINIKYSEAEGVFASFLPPLIFYIRYNPI